jgi:hypothetical protein
LSIAEALFQLLFSHRYDAGAAIDGVCFGGGEEGDRFSRVVENEVFVVLVVIHLSDVAGARHVIH